MSDSRTQLSGTAHKQHRRPRTPYVLALCATAAWVWIAGGQLYPQLIAAWAIAPEPVQLFFDRLGSLSSIAWLVTPIVVFWIVAAESRRRSSNAIRMRDLEVEVQQLQWELLSTGEQARQAQQVASATQSSAKFLSEQLGEVTRRVGSMEHREATSGARAIDKVARTDDSAEKATPQSTDRPAQPPAVTERSSNAEAIAQAMAAHLQERPLRSPDADFWASSLDRVQKSVSSKLVLGAMAGAPPEPARGIGASEGEHRPLSRPLSDFKKRR